MTGTFVYGDELNSNTFELDVSDTVTGQIVS
jgi:hypothetical protein